MNEVGWEQGVASTRSNALNLNTFLHRPALAKTQDIDQMAGSIVLFITERSNTYLLLSPKIMLNSPFTELYCVSGGNKNDTCNLSKCTTKRGGYTVHRLFSFKSRYPTKNLTWVSSSDESPKKYISDSLPGFLVYSTAMVKESVIE